MKGTVKWFKLGKGFGFIKGEDSKEYFVHHSQMPERVERLAEQDEQAVEFDPQDSPRGPQAINVKFVKKTSTEEPTDAPPQDEHQE